MAIKPTFTDIDGNKVVCTLSERNGFDYLEIDRLEEDGSKVRLLTLNMYDAKKMHGACELFMQRSIAKNFANLNGQLTPTDRDDLLVGEED